MSGRGGKGATAAAAVATCESVGRPLEDLFNQRGDEDEEREEIDRVTYIAHPPSRIKILVNTVTV